MIPIKYPRTKMKGMHNVILWHIRVTTVVTEKTKSIKHYKSVNVVLHLFCAVLYCHVWPVWLYHIFPHYHERVI